MPEGKGNSSCLGLVMDSNLPLKSFLLMAVCFPFLLRSQSPCSPRAAWLAWSLLGFDSDALPSLISQFSDHSAGPLPQAPGTSQGLATWLITHLSRDTTCTDHVALMH